MQIKFKRYNSTKGLLGSKSYCVEVMVHPTPEEDELLTRFSKWNESLWIMSDHHVGSDTDMDMHDTLVRADLGQLRQGKRFEFKKMGHVFTTEAVVREAVQNTLASALALASFDGTERVWEVTADEETFVTAG